MLPIQIVQSALCCFMLLSLTGITRIEVVTLLDTCQHTQSKMVDVVFSGWELLQVSAWPGKNAMQH
jgi:hypothetical protein